MGIRRIFRGGGGSFTVTPSPTPTPTPTPTPAAFQTGSVVGANGPKVYLVGPWVQSASTHATWASRGCNVLLNDSANFTEADGDAWLASAKANGFNIIMKPKRTDTASTDYTALSVTDSYWKDHWLAWTITDEPEQETTKDLAAWTTILDSWKSSAGGVTKPVMSNFVLGNISENFYGFASDTYYHYVTSDRLNWLGGDVYPWHYKDPSNVPGLVPLNGDRGLYWQNTYVWGGPTATNSFDSLKYRAFGQDYTAAATGRGIHMLGHGPFCTALDGNGYPITPLSINNSTKGRFHFLATGRVDYGTGNQNGGKWQPGRYQRVWNWDAVIYGSCGTFLFPQTASSLSGTGSITGSTLTLTAIDQARILAPMRVVSAIGGYTDHGIINALTGTGTGGTGTYPLTNAVTALGGTTFTILAPGSTSGDDTNAENAAELAAFIANIGLLQAHPTGGNLLMDPVNGGRRAFTLFQMGDTTTNPNADLSNLTGLTIRSGTGTLNWPAGFVGAEITGDDGKKYRIVLSYNGATSSFTYAPWGVSGKSFAKYEVQMFTDASLTNQLGKAGVDD